MDIVIMDAGGTAIRQSSDFSLDLAYGDDENDFEMSGLSGPALGQGYRWCVDGTQFGGIIDTVGVSVESETDSAVRYSGRDIHGIMASKILEPDSGQSHLAVSGDANDILQKLIERTSLGGWLTAEEEPSGFTLDNYQFNRYIDMWNGIRMMLRGAGARLRVEFRDGMARLSAVPADTYGDMPSELVAFDAERTYRPVNHLIGLGTGEGAARLVSQWYADSTGAVSQAQTLTGLDEVARTYDLSNESDELSAKTRDKLLEYQGQGSFDVSIPEDLGLDVGDEVTASDAVTGISVMTDVVKVVLKVEKGQPSISYETGTPQFPEVVD